MQRQGSLRAELRCECVGGTREEEEHASSSGAFWWTYVHSREKPDSVSHVSSAQKPGCSGSRQHHVQINSSTDETNL